MRRNTCLFVRVLRVYFFPRANGTKNYCFFFLRLLNIIVKNHQERTVEITRSVFSISIFLSFYKCTLEEGKSTYNLTSYQVVSNYILTNQKKTFIFPVTNILKVFKF